MGYHPSAAARSLKTHQTKALGVVVRNIDDPFFSEILQGIEDVAQQEGYSLFISSSQDDSDREQSSRPGDARAPGRRGNYLFDFVQRSSKASSSWNMAFPS